MSHYLYILAPTGFLWEPCGPPEGRVRRTPKGRVRRPPEGRVRRASEGRVRRPPEGRDLLVMCLIGSNGLVISYYLSKPYGILNGSRLSGAIYVKFR